MEHNATATTPADSVAIPVLVGMFLVLMPCFGMCMAIFQGRRLQTEEAKTNRVVAAKELKRLHEEAVRWEADRAVPLQPCPLCMRPYGGFQLTRLGACGHLVCDECILERVRGGTPCVQGCNQKVQTSDIERMLDFGTVNGATRCLNLLYSLDDGKIPVVDTSRMRCTKCRGDLEILTRSLRQVERHTSDLMAHIGGGDPPFYGVNCPYAGCRGIACTLCAAFDGSAHRKTYLHRGRVIEGETVGSHSHRQ